MSIPVALNTALGEKHANQFTKVREQALLLLKTTPATCPHRLVEELNAIDVAGVQWEVSEGDGMGVVKDMLRMMVTHPAHNSMVIGQASHASIHYTKNANGIDVMGQAGASQAAEFATHLIAEANQNSFAGYLGTTFEHQARKEAGQNGLMVDRIALWAIASRVRQENEDVSFHDQFRHEPSLPITATTQELIDLAAANIALNDTPNINADIVQLEDGQGIIRFKAVAGIITAQIEFEEGDWSGLQAINGEATLDLQENVPTSSAEALTGRKLSELIDHPLLNQFDLTITQTMSNDTFKVTMTEDMFMFIPFSEEQ